MAMDEGLLRALVEIAKVYSDGHLTILRFTSNWRVGFITPTDRDDIAALPVGATFEEAALAAIRQVGRAAASVRD